MSRAKSYRILRGGPGPRHRGGAPRVHPEAQVPAPDQHGVRGGRRRRFSTPRTTRPTRGEPTATRISNRRSGVRRTRAAARARELAAAGRRRRRVLRRRRRRGCAVEPSQEQRQRLGRHVQPLRRRAPSDDPPRREQRLGDANWRLRESAILALGAVAEGCSGGLAQHVPCLSSFSCRASTTRGRWFGPSRVLTPSRFPRWVVQMTFLAPHPGDPARPTAGAGEGVRR